MTTAHTPGPWEFSMAQIGRRTDCPTVTCMRDGLPYCVADCDHDIDSQSENEANARLIATAPELLSTVDWLRQTYHRAHHDGDLDTCEKNTCQAARDVMAKAMGTKT